MKDKYTPISILNFLNSFNEALIENIITINPLLEEVKLLQDNCCHPECKVEKLLIFNFLTSQSKTYSAN